MTDKPFRTLAQAALDGVRQFQATQSTIISRLEKEYQRTSLEIAAAIRASYESYANRMAEMLAASSARRRRSFDRS